MSTPTTQPTPANHMDVLVCAPSMPLESLTELTARLTAALEGLDAVVASPDAVSGQAAGEGRLRVVPCERASSRLEWTSTAIDYLSAFELSRSYPARAIVLLGIEAETLSASALRTLAATVLSDGVDLAVPHYDVNARSGLVNSAMLYPVSLALFGARPRFPLAPDLCLSPRMAERLATAAQRFTALNQPDALLWPVAEAALAGFSVADVRVGSRTLPQPAATDLNSLLAQVASSLFADLDQKAAYWQRTRVAQPPTGTNIAHAGLPASSTQSAAEALTEIQPMLDSFRLAYGNLREIWSLVLPPQSLLSLKRLAEMPAASFRMADSLWARIVYDFLLAFRLRTINRGHLLGALTPLYLAWVASHILLTAGGQTAGGMDAEQHVEAQAAAFEADKAYLVSRWRWPDRFNP